jgi:hypothetical protein
VIDQEEVNLTARQLEIELSYVNDMTKAGIFKENLVNTRQPRSNAFSASSAPLS